MPQASHSARKTAVILAVAAAAVACWIGTVVHDSRAPAIATAVAPADPFSLGKPAAQQMQVPDAVDIGYGQAMAAHHDQAIAMARLVQGRASAPIGLLAESIIGNQLLEIGQLRGWLMLWGQPPLSSDSQMRWLAPTTADEQLRYADYLAMCRSNGPRAGAMPGAASTEELERLQSASGTELDTLFLQLMIRHHQGGIPMAEFAKDHAKVNIVKIAARRAVYEQTNEITGMTLLLRNFGKQPLPFP